MFRVPRGTYSESASMIGEIGGCFIASAFGGDPPEGLRGCWVACGCRTTKEACVHTSIATQRAEYEQHAADVWRRPRSRRGGVMVCTAGRGRGMHRARTVWQWVREGGCVGRPRERRSRVSCCSRRWPLEKTGECLWQRMNADCSCFFAGRCFAAHSHRLGQRGALPPDKER